AMAVDHYENFPVASLLLPRALRSTIRDIYRFARTADDIADEGDAPAQERLSALADFHGALNMIETGRPGDSSAPLFRPDIFVPLQDTVARHDLPVSLFRDLISAF